MAKKLVGSGPVQHALVVRNADGEQINGTGTPGDLAAARRLARDILLQLPGASTIDIHVYDAVVHMMVTQPLESVNLDQEETDA